MGKSTYRKSGKNSGTSRKQSACDRDYKKNGRNNRKQQPKADSKDPRVNYDNTRLSRFNADVKMGDDDNDLTWYVRNPEMFKGATTYNFAQIVGDMLQSLRGQTSVPGVMSLAWEPALGGSDQYAINQAKNSIYSFVVHANSRNYKYDATDLMMLIMGGAQLFAAFACPIRAYGTAKRYEAENRYLPDALLTAMGFKPDDFRDHLSTIWFDLNQLIVSTKQIWIPNEMPVIARWFWMNTNIFQDATSVKAQYYMYTPSTILAYQEKLTSKGGCLTPVHLTREYQNEDGTKSYETEKFDPAQNTYSWDEWKVVLKYLIDQLVNAQDRGIILGDVRTAYGVDKMYSLNEIPVDYQVTPVYNQEVLAQIENATILPCESAGFYQDPDDNSYPIFQTMQENMALVNHPDNAAVSRTTSLADSSRYAPSEIKVLNFHTMETPTAGLLMVGSRLSLCSPVGDNTVQVAKLTYPNKPTAAGVATPTAVELTTINATKVPNVMGTEWIRSINIFSMERVFGIKYPKMLRSWVSGFASVAVWSDLPSWFTEFISKWSAFDWAPWINVGYYDATAESTGSQLLNFTSYGDYDNFAEFSAGELQKMHTTAVYSEFGVPYFG